MMDKCEGMRDETKEPEFGRWMGTQAAEIVDGRERERERRRVPHTLTA